MSLLSRAALSAPQPRKAGKLGPEGPAVAWALSLWAPARAQKEAMNALSFSVSLLAPHAEIDDGKRFLKHWELVYEVVGGGGGWGGVTSFRVICRSGQPKNTPKKWEYFLEHFLPPQGWFLVFFPVFFRAFSSTLPIMSDLFVCGSRGPKSVPVLHNFTLLPASPDLGAQGVPGMQGMPGMPGWFAGPRETTRRV